MPSRPTVELVWHLPVDSLVTMVAVAVRESRDSLIKHRVVFSAGYKFRNYLSFFKIFQARCLGSDKAETHTAALQASVNNPLR